MLPFLRSRGLVRTRNRDGPRGRGHMRPAGTCAATGLGKRRRAAYLLHVDHDKAVNLWELLLVEPAIS